MDESWLLEDAYVDILMTSSISASFFDSSEYLCHSFEMYSKFLANLSECLEKYLCNRTRKSLLLARKRFLFPAKCTHVTQKTHLTLADFGRRKKEERHWKYSLSNDCVVNLYQRISTMRCSLRKRNEMRQWVYCRLVKFRTIWKSRPICG